MVLTAGDDTSLERVAILRDEKPRTDVIQQSFVLEEMQSVDNEVHEASAVDGATWWPKLTRVILPYVRGPVLLACLLACLLNCWREDRI